MTGCVYLSPSFEPGGPLASSVVPMLLADTLVTWREAAENGPITPSTVTLATATAPSSVSLIRKLHVVDEVATALAGRADLIRSCVEDLRQFLPQWKKSTRPMRMYGDQVEKYKKYYGNIEAIGIFAYQDSSGLINSMARSDLRDVEHLGKCAQIGSGGPALLELARRYASDFASDLTVPTYRRMRDLALSINARRLVDELFGTVAEGTGGYVEHAFLDLGSRRWCRGPRALNVFWEVSAGNLTEIPRMIAYDPGGENARILTMVKGGVSFSGVPQDECAIDFRLTTGEVTVDSETFWTAWTPEVVTVSIVAREEPTPPVWTTSRPWRSEDVRFRFGSDVRVERGFVESIVDQMKLHMAARRETHVRRRAEAIAGLRSGGPAYGDMHNKAQT